jgi:hypothetical protein
MKYAEQGDRTNAHVAAFVDSGPVWFGRGSSLGVLLMEAACYHPLADGSELNGRK